MANAYIDKIAIAADTYDVNAIKTNGVFYGTVDSTSTATVFTASIEGLTELKNGTVVVLHNGVVTSASGFTINVNGLGAKKCYNNLTNATRDTTIFNIAYTMMFIYSEDLDEGNGGWWCYRGYDANTNTIGYQVRTNSGNLVASDTGYKYRLWLTSADGSKWVPINTSTSTNATTTRTLNTRPIDPFGPIVYRATNGTCSAGTGIGATGIWQQYTFNIGYSYMASRFALTFPDSVFLRCTPQSDGSAVMNDIVQALPTSKDGKIYIHLGTAYSATNMELQIEHPVYWHDGTGIRLWTGTEPSAGGSTVEVTQTLTSGTAIASIDIDGDSTTLYAPTPPTVPGASSTTPSMDGTAAIGTATTYARADHVHPTDTSRQATLVSGTNIKTINGTSILGSGDLTMGGSTVFYREYGTGNVSTGKLTIDGTDYEIWAYSQPSKATSTPLMDGTATIGNSDRYAAENHVHPTDTSRQATLISGTNIKTINGTSLLGSGDLAVGGSVSMEDTAVDAAVDAATYLTNGSSVTITNNAPSYITINKTTVENYSPFVVTCGSSNGTVYFSTTVYSPGSIQLNAITSLPVFAGTETVLLAGAANTTATFTLSFSGGGSND